MRAWVRAVGAVALLVSLAGCQQSGEDAAGAAAPTPSATTSAAPSASASPTPEASPPDAAPVALFFGDSYFVGGGYTEASDSMAQLAADRLGWTAIIRGGGGTGFVSGNPDYDLPNFIGQIDDGALDVDDPSSVGWVVVEGGGNDKDDDPALIEQRATEVLQAAASAYPDARLVLVGTLDPTVDDFSDTDGVIGALRGAADGLGVPYVDAQRWLEGRPDLVGPDYDHPTPEGHVLAGEDLAEALTAIAAG